MIRTLALLVIAAMVAGCSPWGGAPDEERDTSDEPAATATVEEEALEEGQVDATQVEVQEVNDSGISGVALVSPSDAGDSVTIELRLDQSRDTHGVAVRPGSCEDAAASGGASEVIAGATSYTLSDVRDGTMEDEATLPEEIVSTGSYALLVFEGEDVDGGVAACAQVEVE